MRGEENEVYRCERDEYRSALRSQSASERAAACGHSMGRSGSCRFCGAQLVTRDEA